MFIAVVRKRQHNLDQPTTNTQMITEKYRKNATRVCEFDQKISLIPGDLGWSASINGDPSKKRRKGRETVEFIKSEQEDSKKKLFLSATIHHQILQNSSNMFKSSSNWPPKNRPTPMCFSPQMSHLRPAGESPRRWTPRRFPRRCRRRRAGAANGRHGLRKLRRRGRRSAQARRQWHSGGIRGTTWQRRG